MRLAGQGWWGVPFWEDRLQHHLGGKGSWMPCTLTAFRSHLCDLKGKNITFSWLFLHWIHLPSTYSLAKVSFSEMSIWNKLDFPGVKKKMVDLGIQPLCENYLLIKWLKISTFWLGIWHDEGSVLGVTDCKRHRLGSKASYIQLWGACLAWKNSKLPYEWEDCYCSISSPPS